MITPLTKKKKDGGLYTRAHETETLLDELVSLNREELLERAQIRSASASGYIPSECLLFFVRACRNDNSESWFEKLYKILMDRVYRALPESDDPDGITASLTKEAIHNEVVDRFVTLVLEDRREPSSNLDFFEVRFARGIKMLRLDAQEKAWRSEKRMTGLNDEKTGQISAAVEIAAGAIDPREFDNIDDPLFRKRLDAAIDTLPVEQIRTLQMIRKGIPLDSKDPSVLTIAKILGTSEKTVRNYRDRAVASLNALFANGDDK